MASISSSSSTPSSSFSSSAAPSLITQWEKLAPLTAIQLDCIEQLAELQDSSASQPHVQVSPNDNCDPFLSQLNQLSSISSLSDFNAFLLLNNHQQIPIPDPEFSLSSSHVNNNYKSSLSQVNQQLQSATSALQQVETCLSFLTDLEELYTDLSSTAADLKRECGLVSQESSRLSSLADALRSHLSHFDELELLTIEMTASSSIDVFSPSFHQVLQRIEDSITFLLQHPSFLDSKPYLSKFRVLQTRGLTLLRDTILQSLRQTGVRISESFRESVHIAAASASGSLSGSLLSSSASLPTLPSSSSSPSSSALNQISSAVASAASRLGSFVPSRFTPLLQRLSSSSSSPDLLAPPSPASPLSSSSPSQASAPIDPSALLAATTDELRETSLLYVEFQSSLSDLLPLLTQMELHCCSESSSSLFQLLSDIAHVYTQQRWLLLGPVVNARLSSLENKNNNNNNSLSTDQLVRAGCSHIAALCSRERHLFAHFFPASISSSNSLSTILCNYLEKMSNGLYDRLRTRLNAIDDLDELVDLIDVLRSEASTGSQRWSSEVSSNAAQAQASAVMDLAAEAAVLEAAKQQDPFVRIVYRMIGETQKRLVQRASHFIRTEIRAFVASPEDLKYPDKLLKEREEENNRNSGNGLPRSSSGNSLSSMASAATAISSLSLSTTRLTTSKKKQKNKDGEDESAAAAAAASGSAVFFPTLERTLLLLSKLYRAVEPTEAHVFNALAWEAISCCTASFLMASKSIGLSAGATVLDGHLFLVKHLLTLREQMTPFNMDISSSASSAAAGSSSSSIKTIFDFTNLREMLSRFLAGHVQLQALSERLQAFIVRLLQKTAVVVPPRLTSSFSSALSSIPGFAASSPSSSSSSSTPSSADCKREIEKELRAACESFILDATNAAIEPLLTLLARVSDYRRAQVAAESAAIISAARLEASASAAQLPEGRRGSNNVPASSSSLPASSSSTSSIAPTIPSVESMQQSIDATVSNLEAKMNMMQDKVSLYLNNPVTQSILMKPIKANVVEAFAQLQSFVNLDLPAEQKAQLNVPSMEAVLEQLDRL